MNNQYDNNIYKEDEHIHEQEIDLLGYLRIFIKYRWIILISLLFVLALSYFITSRATRIYQASTRILLETTTQSDLFFAAPVSGNTTVNNTIEIIKSRPVLEMTYELTRRHPNFQELPIATSTNPVNYLRKVQTEHKRDTNILTISFSSTSPLEASLVPNFVAQALIEQITQYERAELNNIKDFLEDQVEIVSTRLRLAEEDLRVFKIEQGVLLLSEETRALINRSADVEAAYEEAVTERNIISQKIDYLRQELGRQDELFIDVNSIITSSLIESARAEVVSIQTRITNLITRNEYPIDHPEIIQLNRQLQNAKDNLNNEIQRVLAVQEGSTDPLTYRGSITEKISLALIDLNVAESKVNALRQTVAEYNIGLSLLPDKEVELARLERNYRINEKIHTMLVEKYEDAKIAVQAKLANIRLLEESSVPGSPIKPNKRLNYLVGLIIGLGIGLGSSLVLNSLDTKIHTLDDMQRSVNIPIFGTIPHIRISESDQVDLLQKLKKAEGDEKADLLETQSLIEARLISHYAPKSPVTESYRTLRTNIIARKKTEGPISIGITSSAPKEGKTTTIANLGITMAQTESKVVLVDFDLRRPMIGNLFNLEKHNGVSDFLIDPETKIEQVIKLTKIPNLHVVTSGHIPPNPSEIISSPRTDLMIRELKERYDYVLIDSPPVIAVTDALILAKKVDMILLVVKVDYVEKDIIKRSKEMMSIVETSFTGAIANGIEAHKYYRGYSFYYYYYSNYYYYDEDKSPKKPTKAYIRKLLRKS
ncbi:MAG: polysaccharide biosynthesis tyrosine autokinase [Candidatus Cloacimonetes bacterium]|nr:polysaccharide biosynthesis tyrosine autokinase [Candidatus Cloacimonadota bacterium]